MYFNSLTFLYFFTAVLALNAALPVRFRNAWILIAGFIFYASWSPLCILLLLATAAFDYQIAIRMAAISIIQKRRPWLIASITWSIGSLLFFKYSQMAFDSWSLLARILGHPWIPPHLDIILPLGISFYTFETISYGIDVYRGDLQPKKSFLEYLSFLMFFPKLIAGPIVRASELLPQLTKNRTCSPEQAEQAIHLLAIGFGKKILLADNFAPFIEQVFEHPSAHNRWACLVAIFGYSMQVYLDFSAYTDIARGCARLVGYELPINFRQPYLAVSISDFWQRWHMTLSRWLRDYLYIPLGGSFGSRIKTYRNLFLTMLVGGLWHGANWTFVMWGALNGTFLLIERAWHDLRGTKPKREVEMTQWERLGRIALVFCLITFTRIFFRSPSFSIATEMIATIIHPTVFEAESQLGLLGIPCASLAYIYLARFREQWLSVDFRGWAIPGYVVYLLTLLFFGATRAEFIYFQF